MAVGMDDQVPCGILANKADITGPARRVSNKRAVRPSFRSCPRLFSTLLRVLTTFAHILPSSCPSCPLGA